MTSDPRDQGPGRRESELKELGTASSTAASDDGIDIDIDEDDDIILMSDDDVEFIEDDDILDDGDDLDIPTALANASPPSVEEVLHTKDLEEVPAPADKTQDINDLLYDAYLEEVGSEAPSIEEVLNTADLEPHQVAAGETVSFEEELHTADLDEVNVAATGARPRPDSSPGEFGVPGLQIPTVLDDLLATRGDPKKQLERAQAEAESALEPEAAAVLYFAIGELADRFADDADAALVAREEAFSRDPRLRANLWALRSSYAARGDWEGVARVLEAEEACASTAADRISLQVERAAVLEDRLGRAGEARSLLDDVVAAAPGSTPALLRLERLVLRSGDREAEERILRQLAAVTENRGRRLYYLLDLATAIASGGDDRLVEALAVLDEAIELGVDLERIGRMRVRFAEAAEDWGQVLRGLEEQVSSWIAKFGPAGPPPYQPLPKGAPLDAATLARFSIVALRRLQAKLLRMKQNDIEGAWRHLQMALELVSDEPLLLADLADLAQRLGRYAELAHLCAGLRAVEEDPLRSLSLSLRQAEALHSAGADEQARAVASSVSAAIPGYLGVTSVLERVAIAQADWRGLAEAYERMARGAATGGSFTAGDLEQLDVVGAAALFSAAGDLRASPAVADLSGARDDYARALELEPGFPPAVEGVVALYERSGMLEEASQLLELQSEIDEVVRRQDYLFRLVRIYQELGRVEDEVAALKRIVAMDEGDFELWPHYRLEEGLAFLQRHAERIEVLGDIAAKEVDVPRQVAALFEAARVAHSGLGDVERALEFLRKILELDPEDVMATGMLADLYQRDSRWEELIELRRNQIIMLPDGPDVLRLLLEAADLARSRLGRPDLAVELLRDAYVRLGADTGVILGLLEMVGDSEAARELLAEHVEALDDVDSRILLLDFAEACEAAGDFDSALYIYRRLASEDKPAIQAQLAWVALAKGDAQELARAADALGHGRSDEVAGDIVTSLAWRHYFGGERELASQSFAAAAGGSGLAATLGAALCTAGDDPTGEALANLGISTSGKSAAGLLLRGAVGSAMAGNDESADGRMLAALRAAANDTDVIVAAADGTMLRGHVAEGVVDADVAGARADVLVARAKLAGDDERVWWQLEAVNALERVGRLSEALELLQPVVESHPENLWALHLLVTLCERGGARAALASALAMVGEAAQDSQLRLEYWRRSAQIFDQELDMVDEALAVYEHIVALEPGAAEAGRLRELAANADIPISFGDEP